MTIDVGILPYYKRAWECQCGHINGRSFTAQGWDSDHGPYDICDKCGFETYGPNQDTHRRKVVQEYFLVPAERPWQREAKRHLGEVCGPT